MKDSQLHLIGYASGIAGVDVGCGEGPLVIKNSPYLIQSNINLKWDAMITTAVDKTLRQDEMIKASCEELAHETAILTQKKQFFTVIGGDHSCAIGTFSGVYDAMHQQGDIGLIWIDAHMDSHTPETSESGHIHGMPLAVLMGFGYPTLTMMAHPSPKLKPENVCLIGVRSFERGEEAFLKRHHVKIYFMDEVKQRGFQTILQEAKAIVSEHTVAYGISIDLDSIDPQDAPGVDVPEPHGILAKDIYQGMLMIINDPHIVALELTEFNPLKDKNHITEKLIISFLEMLAKHR